MLCAEQIKAFSTDPASLSTESASGGGFYSTVYAGKLPGTVVKHGGDLRDGWLLWAAYCMSRPRPSKHLPRILALHVDLDREKFFALIEKLEENNRPTRLRGGSVYQITTKPTSPGERPPNTAVAALRGACKWIAGFYNNDDFASLDCHIHNWMRREDGTVVLTDPFSSSEVDPLEILRHIAPRSQGRITFKE